MKVHFSADTNVRTCLRQIGRTEDISVTPSGDRIALAGFNAEKVYLFDMLFTRSGKKPYITLKNPVEISSAGMHKPHGLSFLNDHLLVVVNREGGAELIRLPPEGTSPKKFAPPTVTGIPDNPWLYSPGSICNYQNGPNDYKILICNNYANYVSRHSLNVETEVALAENELLIARGLDLPDGVAVSESGHWIAVSNHNMQDIRLYANQTTLNRNSEPSAILHGTSYPHGIAFTADERFIVIADAGSPFLRLYAKSGNDWRGSYEPLLSLRAMSDDTFALGHVNPMEGGIKGIHRLPKTNIFTVTSEYLPLAFFDLDKILNTVVFHKGSAASLNIKGGQRCPCGNRKAFRKCCGASRSPVSDTIPTSVESILQEAIKKIQAARFRDAEQLCEQVLEMQPGHSKATHMLGYVHYRRGSLQKASQLLRNVGNTAGWADTALRHHYSQALGARLTGILTATRARLRCRYARWIDDHLTDHKLAPLVSIVLVTDDSADHISAALESLYSQSYSNIEIVLMETGQCERTRRCIQEKLPDSPFPSRWESVTGLSIPAALNSGIALAQGEFINPLDPDDLFEPGRIATLVAEVAKKGYSWGFSACDTIDEKDESINTADNKLAELLQRSLEGIHSNDTVGSSLFGVTNPVASVGNLFFAKKLFQKTGGFRDLEFNFDWEFSLRALWEAEPHFVDSSLYRYRLLRKRATGRFSADALNELEDMLAEYCTRADSENPGNEFAPSDKTMGFGYLICALDNSQTRIAPARLMQLDDKLLQLESQCDGSTAADLGNGLNVVGYFRGSLGLGESARNLANTCISAGVAVNLQDAGLILDTTQQDNRMDHLLTDCNDQSTTLFCINPDRLESVWQRYSTRGALSNRRVIAMWYWEMDQFPDAWLPALGLFDEFWVSSSFVEQLIKHVTDKPVIRIPPAIEASLSCTYQRDEFGLPEDRFLFLFNFDFNSFNSRKNPWAALDAFKCAFPDNENHVGLVIKSLNGDKNPAIMSRLQLLAKEDSRIIILDRYLTRDQMYGLQSTCNAYVSLHRAEGFGLGMAECMALGVPVIGTAYSGNLDFMNSQNSYLVNYSLIPVKPEEYLHYQPGWMWADPDIGEAARHMRHVYDNPEDCQRKASQAAADIAKYFSRNVSAMAIQKRLKEIHNLNAF